MRAFLFMKSSHMSMRDNIADENINIFKCKQAKVSCTAPVLSGTGVGSLVGGAATFWKTNVQLSLLALVRLLSVVKGNRGLKCRNRGPVSCTHAFVSYHSPSCFYTLWPFQKLCTPLSSWRSICASLSKHRAGKCYVEQNDARGLSWTLISGQTIKVQIHLMLSRC